MRHEEIIPQQDGSKIKATVVFYDNDYSKTSAYRIELLKCDKGKRTFYKPYDEDSYKYRALSMADRANETKNNIINIIGKETYNQLLINAWNKLKPQLL